MDNKQLLSRGKRLRFTPSFTEDTRRHHNNNNTTPYTTTKTRLSSAYQKTQIMDGPFSFFSFFIFFFSLDISFFVISFFYSISFLVLDFFYFYLGFFWRETGWDKFFFFLSHASGDTGGMGF